VRAGLTFGYADLVDGLIRRQAEAMDAKPKVIATGGIAKFIGSLCDGIDEVEPWLTLNGLRIIFEKNEGAA